MYAIIRVRGTVNVAPKIKKTLDLMSLRRVNNLVVVREGKEVVGMIKRVKDYVTYGKIDDSTLEELIAKKGAPIKKGDVIDPKKVVEELKKGGSLKKAGVKNIFRLSPPVGGHERKGIKMPYKLGGVLGDRGEKINELIRRMM